VKKQVFSTLWCPGSKANLPHFHSIVARVQVYKVRWMVRREAGRGGDATRRQAPSVRRGNRVSSETGILVLCRGLGIRRVCTRTWIEQYDVPYNGQLRRGLSACPRSSLSRTRFSILRHVAWRGCPGTLAGTRSLSYSLALWLSRSLAHPLTRVHTVPCRGWMHPS
jgi:hypothetical protein